VRRNTSTAFAWLIVALSVVSAALPTVAAAESIFSTATNQYGTTASGATILQQGTYSTRNGVEPLVAPFVSGFLGLNGMAVGANSIYFSVVNRGQHYFNSPIPVMLESSCGYRYDLDTGSLAPLNDWASLGIRLGSLDALDPLWDGSIAFSTETHQYVLQEGTMFSLRHENVYRFDPISGLFELFFDGQALGLSALDAVDVLENGRVVFSTPTNRFVLTPRGGMVLRQQNAYLVRDLGIVELALDGIAIGLQTLDAIDLDVMMLAIDGDLLHWSALAGSSGSYDLVRGDLLELARTGGEYSAATVECLASGQAEWSLLYPPNPNPGEGYWFVVRDSTDTYDTDAASQVGSRDAGIAASGAGCP